MFSYNVMATQSLRFYVLLPKSPWETPLDMCTFRVGVNSNGSLILSWVESDDENDALYYSSLVNEDFRSQRRFHQAKLVRKLD